jgi:hypothetical protein
MYYQDGKQNPCSNLKNVQGSLETIFTLVRLGLLHDRSRRELSISIHPTVSTTQSVTVSTNFKSVEQFQASLPIPSQTNADTLLCWLQSVASCSRCVLMNWCAQCIPIRLPILSKEREVGALHAVVGLDGVYYYTGIIRAQREGKVKGEYRCRIRD